MRSYILPFPCPTPRGPSCRRAKPMNTLYGVDARRANVNPVLTIILTCYNTRDIVRDCLNSIYKHPPSENYEIILVDDASTDGTSEMARATFPEIRLLRNEINQN